MKPQGHHSKAQRGVFRNYQRKHENDHVKAHVFTSWWLHAPRERFTARAVDSVGPDIVRPTLHLTHRGIDYERD